MVNLRKKSLIFFAIFFMIFNSSIIVKAENKRVIDEARLLNSSEINLLDEKINKLIEKTNLDVVIVTTNNTSGKSSMEYADDFYDYNGYGFDKEHSGILLLINMEEREVWISTTGKGVEYYTDGRIDNILDSIEEYLAGGDYYKACDWFLNKVDKYYSDGIPKGFQRIEERNDFKTNLLIAGIGSLATAIISCIVVTISYKNPSKHKGANYVEQGNIHYTRKDDVFISTHTHKTKIERNNTSNTSTTHTSSSGRSHGGGGRKF